MTVGEATALVGLFMTITGIFIRYGIVLPMKNVIQPLEISITGLREEVASSKKFQENTQAILQNHDVRISLQEQKTKVMDSRIEKLDR